MRFESTPQIKPVRGESGEPTPGEAFEALPEEERTKLLEEGRKKGLEEAGASVKEWEEILVGYEQGLVLAKEKLANKQSERSTLQAPNRSDPEYEKKYSEFRSWMDIKEREIGSAKEEVAAYEKLIAETGQENSEHNKAKRRLEMLKNE